MVCIFGIDIIKGSIHGKKRPKYALYILRNSKESRLEQNREVEVKEVSRAKLFRMIKLYKPEIIAIDNVSELFSSKEDIISFLKKLPDVKLVQVAGKISLPSLAKRYGLKMDIKNPMDEAKACAILASFGVGEEVSVFTDKTKITVSRNRSLGKGGWRQNRYRRRIHDEVRKIYKEIKNILDEYNIEYEEKTKKGYGGISKGIILVNAPKREVPISPFKTGNVQVRVEAVEKERVEFIPLCKHTTYTIVGVDPGTTTAIAILNLDGDLLGIKSRKGWNISEVVEYILEFGKPVIVSTDKHTPPDFVSKLRASFNAVLYTPKEDTSVEKKKSLVLQFKDYISNDHERDALSAAIEAYNAYKSKLLNVERRVPVGVDVDAVKAGIIRGLTLREILREKEKKQTSKKVRRRKEERKFSDRVLKELEEENRILRREVEELRLEVEKLKSRIVAMAREEHEKIRKDNYIKTLEAEISKLRRLLKEKNEELKELKNDFEELKKVKMLEFSGWKSVKLLRKLTRDYIEKTEKQIGLFKDDIVLIPYPEGGGRSQAEHLCSKGIKAVITKVDNLSHTALSVFEENDIPLIDVSEINLKVADDFAVVNFEEFEEIYKKKVEEIKRKKVEKFEKIILDYRNRFK